LKRKIGIFVSDEGFFEPHILSYGVRKRQNLSAGEAGMGQKDHLQPIRESLNHFNYRNFCSAIKIKHFYAQVIWQFS